MWCGLRQKWSDDTVPTKNAISQIARQLLTAIEALPDAEREPVVAEHLTRHPVGAGALPEAALVELADELFRSYDAEEAADATRPTD